MPFRSIIAQKRDNFPLSAEDIRVMVDGITDGSLSDAQLSAFGMAIYLNGMSIEETAELTLAMRNSGQFLGWDLPGPVVDKHSTGGVGDMVSLILGPMLAACGLYVPMISGRGLGHTGGTVDKLESIPGYNTHPDIKHFQACVEKVGVAIIGQTENLAPADRRFYSIRDHAACVESIPLITSSILAKKLAEGIDCLVMDVKVGNGAFMPSLVKATELADSIALVADKLGLKVASLLTDMNSPLAYSAGNGLEIREVIQVLTGQQGHPGLYEVTLRTASEMLIMAGVADSQSQALARCRQVLSNGDAAQRFARMVSFLGGPEDLLESPDKYLATAPVVKPVAATQDGYVQGYNTVKVGMLTNSLGAGRAQKDSVIDHSVGLNELIQVGEKVSSGQTLAVIHAKDESSWQQAAERFNLHCINITDQPVSRPERVVACRYPRDIANRQY